jgi:hypothetical protein
LIKKAIALYGKALIAIKFIVMVVRDSIWRRPFDSHSVVAKDPSEKPAGRETCRFFEGTGGRAAERAMRRLLKP